MAKEDRTARDRGERNPYENLDRLISSFDKLFSGIVKMNKTLESGFRYQAEVVSRSVKLLANMVSVVDKSGDIAERIKEATKEFEGGIASDASKFSKSIGKVAKDFDENFLGKKSKTTKNIDKVFGKGMDSVVKRVGAGFSRGFERAVEDMGYSLRRVVEDSARIWGTDIREATMRLSMDPGEVNEYIGVLAEIGSELSREYGAVFDAEKISEFFARVTPVIKDIDLVKEVTKSIALSVKSLDGMKSDFFEDMLVDLNRLGTGIGAAIEGSLDVALELSKHMVNVTQQDLSGMLDTFGSFIAAKATDADDFKRMTDSLYVATAAAKEAGVEVGDFTDMLNLLSSTDIDKISEVYERYGLANVDLYDSMERVRSGDFTGALDIIDGMKETMSTSGLTAGTLAKVFGMDEEAFNRMINSSVSAAGSLDKALGLVADAGGNVRDQMRKALQAQPIMESLRNAFETSGAGVISLGDALNKTGLDMGKSMGLFKQLGLSGGQSVTALGGLGVALMALQRVMATDEGSEAFMKFFEDMGEVISDIMEIFYGLVDAITPLIISLLPVLVNIMRAVFNIIEKVMEVAMPIITDIVMPLIDILTPLVLALLPILINVLGTVLSVVTKVIGAVMPIISSVLLPLMRVLTPLINTLLLPLLENILVPLVSFLAKFGVAIMAIVVAMKLWSVVTTIITIVTKVWGVVQAVVNAIMSANPIFLIIIGIIALIAAIVLLVNYWDKVVAVLKKGWDWIKDAFGKGVEWIKGVWKSIESWFKGLWSRISGWFKAVWDGVVSIFTKVWGRVVEELSMFWKNIGGDKIVAWAKGVIDTVVNFFKGIWDTVSSFFVGVWKGIVDIFSKVKGFISKVFADIWAGVVSIFSSVVGWIVTAFNKVVNFFRGLGEGIANFFVGIWDGIVNLISTGIGYIRSIFSGIGNLFIGIWDGIVGGIRSVWDGIVGIWGRFSSWVYDNIKKPILDFISGVKVWVVDVIARFIRGIFNIVAFIKNIGSSIQGLFKGVVKFFAGIGDKIRGTVTGIIGGIVNAFMDIGDRIHSVFDMLWGTVSNFFVGLWDNIVDVFNILVDKFNDAKSRVVDFFMTLWESIVGVFNNIKEKLSEAWTNVVEFFNGLGESIGGIFNNIKDKFTMVKDFLVKIASIIGATVHNVIAGFWNNVANMLNSAFNGVVSFLNSMIRTINLIPGINISAISSVNLIPTIALKDVPKLDIGMRYVPYNEMPALLHEGEAVLTREEADEWRAGRLRARGGADSVDKRLVIDYSGRVDKIIMYEKMQIDRLEALITINNGILSTLNRKEPLARTVSVW